MKNFFGRLKNFELFYDYGDVTVFMPWLSAATATQTKYRRGGNPETIITK